MEYTLHQLKVFNAVAKARSITKAAELLHLTQPAVSIQLKNFQNQFDIPLTEVVGRQLFVTDFGHEILIASERILDEVNQINHKTQLFKGKLSGLLKISIVSTAKYIMPYFLTDFLAKHEEVTLKMDVTNKSTVLKHLEENLVDFSMVSVLPSHISVESISLMKNELYLVCNSHLVPNEPKKHYDLKFLNEIPIIFREEGSGTRLTAEKFLLSHNMKLTPKLELTSNEAVKQAVLAGLGYSIMPLIGIKNEVKEGLLKIIPLAKLPITTNWHLVWPKGKNLSPVAGAFLSHIQLSKEQTIYKQFNMK